jgi:hypothetical protein
MDDDFPSCSSSPLIPGDEESSDTDEEELHKIHRHLHPFQDDSDDEDDEYDEDDDDYGPPPGLGWSLGDLLMRNTRVASMFKSLAQGVNTGPLPPNPAALPLKEVNFRHRNDLSFADAVQISLEALNITPQEGPASTSHSFSTSAAAATTTTTITSPIPTFTPTTTPAIPFLNPFTTTTPTTPSFTLPPTPSSPSATTTTPTTTQTAPTLTIPLIPTFKVPETVTSNPGVDPPPNFMKLQLDKDFSQKIKEQKETFTNFLSGIQQAINRTQEVYDIAQNKISHGTTIMESWLQGQWDKLQEKEKAIAIRMKQIEEERKRVLELESIQDDAIELDVGGKRFVTTKASLAKYDSFFSVLVSGRFGASTWSSSYRPASSPSSSSDKNSKVIFIDRDPKMFRYIINFLRTGLIPEILSDYDLQLLQEEADYYQIPPLITALQMRDVVRLLYPQDAQMKRVEGKSRFCFPNTFFYLFFLFFSSSFQDNARQLFVKSPQEARANGPHWLLLRVFDNVSSFQYNDQFPYPAAFVHLKQSAQSWWDDPPLPATVKGFKDNWEAMSIGILDKVRKLPLLLVFLVLLVLVLVLVLVIYFC